MENRERVFTVGKLGFNYGVDVIRENLDRYVEEFMEFLGELKNGQHTVDSLAQKLNEDKNGTTYNPGLSTVICRNVLDNFASQKSSNDGALVALAFWQMCKFKKVGPLSEFKAKGIQGGRQLFQDSLDNGGKFTCIDTSSVTLAMSKELGIDGSIEHDGISSLFGFHHYFQSKTGKVIDIPFGVKEGGFFASEDEHPGTHQVVLKTAGKIAKALVGMGKKHD